MKLSWVLLGAAAAASPALGQYVSVRSPYGVSSEAERALNEVAQPVEVEVPAGVDPITVARNLCGRVSPTYAALLADANRTRSLEPPPRAAVFAFPACFILRARVSVRPLEGETLKGLSERIVGASGPKSVGRILEANHGLLSELSGSSQTPATANLGTDKLLEVPNATETAIYKLRPEAAANARAAIAELSARVGPDDVPDEIDLARELNLESRVPTGVSLIDPASCGASRRPPFTAGEWPFDGSALLDVLKANDMARRTLGLAAPEPTIVAVADNGVDGLFTLFSGSVLAINGQEVPGDLQDNDGNGWIDDVAGANVFFKKESPGVQEGKDPWHGTHLSGLVLGGIDYPGRLSAREIAPRIKLLPISLIDREVMAVPGVGNRTRYKMPIGAVETAIDYAVKRRATVVNLSVSTRDKMTTLLGQLSRLNNVLLIAAAGNQANLYDADPLYPAGWGGKPHEAIPLPVVSVAAHDMQGCLAAFSGRGSERIDLAAPGVDISSTDLNGQMRTVSGTSQATALVSFAAGLVRAEGLSDPMLIKQRLLASADFEPDLQDYVYYGARLNLLKAVSRFHDVVELKGAPRQLRRGVIVPALTLGSLCPQFAGQSGTILKISPAATASQISVLIRWTANNNLQQKVCTPASAEFKFADGSTFAFRDVLDVVFKN